MKFGEIPTDYSFNKSDVSDMMGASVLPDEFRRKVLKKVLEERGPEEIIRLFSQFIGMANSVSANTRSHIEEYLVIECKHYPDTAAKINLPTVQGALEGVGIAVTPTPKMCQGCAFRLGSPANQCHVTTLDAKDAADGEFVFMCHEDLTEEGKVKTACAGFVESRK